MLIKYTNLDPDSEAGKLVLNDHFITQAASDIRRKIQKMALGTNTTSTELLRAASSVFYNGDREDKEREKEKHKVKRQAQLLAILQV